MSTLVWKDPPVKRTVGRPNICAYVLDQLIEHPNQWAIYPTKAKTKNSKYVIARNFRIYATKHNTQIECIVHGNEDNAKIFVRFVGYTKTKTAR